MDLVAIPKRAALTRDQALRDYLGRPVHGSGPARLKWRYITHPQSKAMPRTIASGVSPLETPTPTLSAAAPANCSQDQVAVEVSGGTSERFDHPDRAPLESAV